MSWEQHGKGRFYYRVFRRPCGRLAKSYCRRGPAADAAAKADAEAREAHEQERAAARAVESQLKPLDDLAKELDEGLEALVEASLLLAGYHKHRGQWRPNGRRRRSPIFP
jgi:hypothetical protein